MIYIEPECDCPIVSFYHRQCANIKSYRKYSHYSESVFTKLKYTHINLQLHMYICVHVLASSILYISACTTCVLPVPTLTCTFKSLSAYVHTRLLSLYLLVVTVTCNLSQRPLQCVFSLFETNKKNKYENSSKDVYSARIVVRTQNRAYTNTPPFYCIMLVPFIQSGQCIIPCLRRHTNGLLWQLPMSLSLKIMYSAILDLSFYDSHCFHTHSRGLHGASCITLAWCSSI